MKIIDKYWTNFFILFLLWTFVTQIWYQLIKEFDINDFYQTIISIVGLFVIIINTNIRNLLDYS